MASIARLIDLYVIVLFARILLSWFPVSRGGAMESIHNVLYTLTEPILGPLRRTIPSAGGFDFSPMVAIIGLELLASAIRG